MRQRRVAAQIRAIESRSPGCRATRGSRDRAKSISRRTAALLTRMSSRPNASTAAAMSAAAASGSATSAIVTAARPPALADLLRHGLGLRVRRARVHDDGRAGARQLERDGAADVARAAGDDGDAAGQTCSRPSRQRAYSLMRGTPTEVASELGSDEHLRARARLQSVLAAAARAVGSTRRSARCP